MTISRFHFTWQSPSVSSLVTLVIVSALVLQSCATPTPRQPPPRGDAQILEIEVTEQLPRITLELPSKGAASGAGRKSGKWAGNWAMASAIVTGSGFYGGNVITMMATAVVGGAMLALTPVVAAAGAVKGAFESPSTESVESGEAQVRGILQAEDLPQRLREQVLKEVADKTSIILAGQHQAEDTIVAQEKAAGPGEGRQPDRVHDVDLEWLLYGHHKVGPGEEHQPKSILRTGEGHQPKSILKIQLKSLELRGPYEVDPELALHIEAEVTLATPPAGSPIYTFRYVTRALRLSEWVANDATLFTEAVNLSLARLAELIVDDLLLTYDLVDIRS